LLLIEDDSELALLLVRYLGRSGVEVTHVSDGTVGVDAFLAASRTAHPFDVVLTDGLVPGKNGFLVAQAIRASPAGSRVGLALFSAAFRSARAQADAAQAGFDAYYAKPFVLTDLRDGLLKLAARSVAAASQAMASGDRLPVGSPVDPTSPQPPTGRRAQLAPLAWAQSSTTLSPWRWAMAQTRSMSTGRPNRCTGSRALVAGVIAASS
jgi:CheY-like chemotaxis protein